MSIRWIVVMSLLVSACGAASDVGTSAAPSSVGLIDAATTAVEFDEPEGLDSSSSTTSTSVAVTTEPTDDSTTTSSTGSTQTSAPSSTTGSTATVPVVDPNAAFCRAAIKIDELGTFVALDDTAAATIFFNTQVDRWDAAATAAPLSIAADVRTVATFHADLRSLLAANDFDLFAVFEEVTELEVTSGSDLARIRADQFIFAKCEVEPPLPAQSTAVFYGELLSSTENRTVLAELLASAEVFTLEGAQCFVSRATPGVMHPLVGAPATPAQDAALANVLSACQISIGT